MMQSCLRANFKIELYLHGGRGQSVGPDDHLLIGRQIVVYTSSI